MAITTVMHVPAGTDITQASAKAIELLASLQDGDDVQFDFNEITITATKDSTARSLVEDYLAKIDTETKKYRSTEEYKTAEIQRQIEADKNKEALEIAFVNADTLNSYDHIAVCSWFITVLHLIDQRNVITPEYKRRFLEILDGMGYKSGDLVGNISEYFDTEQMIRWSAGQVIDMLQEIGAVHPAVSRGFESILKVLKDQK